jgi:hypothetical protein
LANRPRVIVIERMDALGPDLLRREADLIELYDRPGETLEQHLPEADGLVVRIAQITAERIAMAPRHSHNPELGRAVAR